MMRLDRGQIIVSILKDGAGLPGAELYIPVGKPIKCLLRPIATHPDLLNQNDIYNLTTWRNRFVSSFLSEFNATEERTANWLTEVVRFNESKILFMIDDLEGKSFGYMGLDFIDWKSKSGEADSIVRGEYAAPGTMKIALQSLLSWAKVYLGISDLGVRVRSDNTALNFYRKAGFREISRIPLEYKNESNIISWVENRLIDSDLSLVHMKYSQSANH